MVTGFVLGTAGWEARMPPMCYTVPFLGYNFDKALIARQENLYYLLFILVLLSSMWRSWGHDEEDSDSLPVIRPAINTEHSSAIRTVVQEVPVIRPQTNSHPDDSYRSVVNSDDHVPVICPATNVESSSEFRSVVKSVPVIRPATYTDSSYRSALNSEEQVPVIRPATNTDQAPGKLKLKTLLSTFFLLCFAT